MLRWVAASAVVIAAGGGVWIAFGGDPAVSYDTAPVLRRDLENALTASGRILPRAYVDVGAQVSGRLERIHVGIGDRIDAGQLLAEIDAEVQAAQVEGMEAGIAGLVAERAELETLLAFAQRQVSRHATLAGRASAVVTLQEAERDRDILTAQIEGKDAALRRSQAELRGEKATLAHTRITAPMAGTITALDAREGQTLNANYDTPVLMRIADLGTMTIRAEVSEADVVHLRAEMPVWFTTLGLPDHKYRAALRQILPAPPEPKETADAEAAGKVVNYIALFDVANTDGVLMSGMTAQVFFVTDAATDVLSVPLAALDDDGRVRVLGPSGPQVRTPELGMRTRSHVEVRTALTEGDRVITGIRHDDTPSAIRIVP